MVRGLSASHEETDNISKGYDCTVVLFVNVGSYFGTLGPYTSLPLLGTPASQVRFRPQSWGLLRKKRSPCLILSDHECLSTMWFVYILVPLTLLVYLQSVLWRGL